jgi:DNA-binding Lrp family transcriptional regulator
MDELLKILQANAIESRENIAKMLNISVAEVNQRIAKYEKSGVIRGYQAILNEDQLGLDTVTAVIEVKVSPQREGGFNTCRRPHQPFSRSALGVSHERHLRRAAVH